MADATVNVIEQQVVVTPFGVDAIEPYITTATSAATAAASSASLARNSVPFATWTALAAATGMNAGNRATVRADDSGTHTDPVVGGTVSNAGNYLYSASPAGWERVADLDSQVAQAYAPTTFETTIAYGMLVLDAGGRIIGEIPDPAVAELVASAVTASIYETTDISASSYLLDAGGRIIAALGGSSGSVSSTETVTARGSRLALNDRLSQSLDAYGSPLDSFNANRMRRYHYKVRKRALGEAARLIIGLWGDSFTHLRTRWAGDFATTLIALYGDGGGGWTGAGFGGSAGTFAHGGTQPSSINGNARSTYGVSYSGAWDRAYATVPSPDTCCAVSSTATAEIRLTFPASPTLSGVDLFWIGTADGVMRYSWNGTTWTTINVQGTVDACSSAALADVPGSGSGTLYLQVVSGTCKPAGVNWKSAASGVVVHKLAATGSRMQQLATQAAVASWRTAIAALETDSALVMHGTNDQGADPARTESEFSADATTVLNGLQAAVPGIDRLLIMPPENQRTDNEYPMTLYKAAGARAAATLGVAFLDQQRNFGDPANPTEYGSSGATPLFNVDLIHPEPGTGGRALLDGVLRFLSAA
jgi:hypothetical protein